MTEFAAIAIALALNKFGVDARLGVPFSGDDQYLTWPALGRYGEFFHSWSMAAEFERRYRINARPERFGFCLISTKVTSTATTGRLPFCEPEVRERISQRCNPTVIDTASR